MNALAGDEALCVIQLILQLSRTARSPRKHPPRAAAAPHPSQGTPAKAERVRPAHAGAPPKEQSACRAPPRRDAKKAMINFLLLVSRQGKTRLTKWYESYAAKEKARIVREITATVLARAPKMCNFVEWRNKKIIYKRYASLFFIVCVDAEDNELITLEMIHLYVEVLDRYFGNVCELDIIFNFHKAYYILDEIFVGGELCESSKKEVLSVCAQMDELMEEREEDKAAGGSSGRVRK